MKNCVMSQVFPLVFKPANVIQIRVAASSEKLDLGANLSETSTGHEVMLDF